MKDLFRERNFMSFQQLQGVFGLPSSNFFRYLQLRSFVEKHFSPTLQTPAYSWIEKCLGVDPLQRGAISTLYALIHTAAVPTLDRIKEQWQLEMGLQIIESQLLEFLVVIS